MARILLLAFLVIQMWCLSALGESADHPDHDIDLQFTRLPSGVAATPSEPKVLIIVPGFGFHGNRLQILYDSLNVAMSSAVDSHCMVFNYADQIPDDANVALYRQLLSKCSMMPYFFGNFGDYVKAVPPPLIQMSGFTHVMLLLDDVKLHRNFDLREMLGVIRRNNLTVASPVVHGAKYASSGFGRRATRAMSSVGYKTLVLEIFATVFTLEGWNLWWNLVDPMINSAGEGYGVSFREFSLINGRCPHIELGVLSKMEATHVDPADKVVQTFKPAFAVNSRKLPGHQKIELFKLWEQRRNTTMWKADKGYMAGSLL